jgi:prepilin-type N-terminal cleavage/methylation domain-containing protein
MKLRAFTIMELVVVMVISGIVTGIAFFGYSVSSIYFRRFHDSALSITRVSLLHSTLENDFREAVMIRQPQANTIVLTKKNETVSYSFSEGGVVRENPGSKEVFPLRLSAVSILFEGLPAAGFLDEVYFETDHGPFHFSKLYSSEELMAIHDILTTGAG